jgi:nitrogenase subunit NifH
MDIIKPRIKTQDPKDKEQLKQNKINKYSILEDFVESEGFKEYNKLLDQVIHRITSEILNDNNKEDREPVYSLKYIKILLRKELVSFRDRPLQTLKSLSYTADKLGSTQ